MFVLFSVAALAAPVPEFNEMSSIDAHDDASILKATKEKIAAFRAIEQAIVEGLEAEQPSSRASLLLTLAQANEELAHFLAHNPTPETLSVDQGAYYRAQLFGTALPMCQRAREAYSQVLQVAPDDASATAGLSRLTAGPALSSAEIDARVDRWLESGPMIRLAGNLYGERKAGPGPGRDRLHATLSKPEVQACLAARDF